MLPRAVWVWSRSDRQVQIWVDSAGHPIEVDVDLSDLLPPVDLADGSTQRRASRADEVLRAALAGDDKAT